MRKRWIFMAPLAVVGLLLFIALGGEVVMLLWNWLAPAIFSLREITFWQALGILALSRILFGGFGGRGFSRSKRLSSEEREKFRERMRERCGGFNPTPSESQGQ